MLETLLLIAAVVLFILDYFVRWSLIAAGLACFAASFLVAGIDLAIK